jgi:hypothetical protein
MTTTPAAPRAAGHLPVAPSASAAPTAPVAPTAPLAPTAPRPRAPHPAARTRRAKAKAALAGCLVVLFGVFLAGAVPQTVVSPADSLFAASFGPAPKPSATGSSALTKHGRGDFADLAVSVSQTRDLVNQSVVVTWKWSGADKHATRVSGLDTYQTDYLQIMQCWGDDSPDRTQCQFGARRAATSSFSTTYMASRQIFPGSDPRYTGGKTIGDPDDKDITTASADYYDASSQSYTVPFRPVHGALVKGPNILFNPYFGPDNTNELPAVATHPDGTGFETFEALTFRESDGLGCGQIATEGREKGKPRSCWLVVVPRGRTEVDGKTDWRDLEEQRLHSSPLSASNWANRIVFPLGFAPIEDPCPQGTTEFQVSGVESASAAVSRWIPALCENGGPVFASTKLADPVAEQDLIGDTDDSARGLSFLNAPVAPGDVPSDRILVYAPVAVTGVSIGVLIERQPRQGAPPGVEVRRRERVSDLKLTPRLVAKVLTQSYPASAGGPKGTYLKGNPRDIDSDPEFLKLNPEFADLAQAPDNGIQLLLPTGLAETIDVVWRWIAADQDARDFVAGVPDPWGMTVNPFYQGISIPQDGFPRIDPYCERPGVVADVPMPPLCVFDKHPYTLDLGDSARLVSRGDTGMRMYKEPTEDQFAANPVKKVPVFPPGSRSVIGITDTPSAARYQLVTAKLRNASGAFVAPDTKGLLAGVTKLRPTAVAGVSVPQPEFMTGAAYPLTEVTYAAAAPVRLTADSAKQLARFIRFAVGPGQTPGTGPGTLPDGYAPLPAAMRKQALAAADRVQARVGPPGSRPSGPGDRPGGGGSGSGSGSGSGAGSGTGATPTATPPATPTPAATTPTNTKAAGARTPGDPPVATRFVVVAVLILGIAGGIFGPLLPRLARRLRQ